MSPTETVIEGTLQADGTLVLDVKPNLPPGRVTVLLRQQAPIVLPKGDPFWQRMQAMWAAQAAGGHVPRSDAEIELQQREMREGWERRQKAIETLQEESRASVRLNRDRHRDGLPRHEYCHLLRRTESDLVLQSRGPVGRGAAPQAISWRSAI